MIYARNSIWSSALFLAQSSLGCSHVTRAPKVTLMDDFVTSCKVGALAARRANFRIRRLELLVPHSLTSGEGEGLEIDSVAYGQGFNQSCLCNEGSIKTEGTGFRKFPGGRTHGDVGNSGVLREAWKLLALVTFLVSASLPSGCSWAVSFHNKLAT